MKLYYYKDDVGNFGDDINPWLWDRLLPGFFDDDSSSLFVGIGSLLNHRIPAEASKIIFSSGYGYGELPIIDKSWKFYCVRGPLTAKALGLPKSCAVTDGATLIRSVITNQKESVYPVSYMPHCASALNADWENICRELSLHYIDPSESVGSTIDAILKSDLLITEALHGAVVADALRTPWIPVKCYNYIFEFKWRDWLETLQIPYEPLTVPEMWDAERNMSMKRKLKFALKRRLMAVRIWDNSWEKPSPPKTNAFIRQQVLEILNKCKNDKKSFLSTDIIIENLTQELLSRLERFKRDFSV